MEIRKSLHANKDVDSGYKKAPYVLSKNENKIFCKSLSELRLPDGYSSNIASHVPLKDYKIYELKSHDCHVLMQPLLPVALRGPLDKVPRIAIFRLCALF